MIHVWNRPSRGRVKLERVDRGARTARDAAHAASAATARRGLSAARGTGARVGSAGSCRCGCNNHTLASQFSCARSALQDARRRIHFSPLACRHCSAPRPVPILLSQHRTAWAPVADTDTHRQALPHRLLNDHRASEFLSGDILKPVSGDWLTDYRSNAKNNERFQICDRIYDKIRNFTLKQIASLR